ncbi:hypothetical protein [Myxococcus qinghaiensis]|uniref:hypothetical protein n=1 Tax=Myxococcus qinghaiensis TaxID=2906758 RepID=UPI0020A7530F|nr:hypothetical protein [Myxococcus qinghaiensis]MCP3169483.1 hypothetical protein [Myxococcus qinghaiensis]
MRTNGRWFGLTLLTAALCLAACDSDDDTPGPDDAGVGDAGTADAGGSDAGADAGPTDPSSEQGDGVSRESTVVGGHSVDRYTWTDSRGRPRTVSLKRQTSAGNGGYAVQLTYQVQAGADWRTVTVDGTAGGESGFGYFVGHELYRTFDNGASGTIAGLHGEDDSPLGYGFAVQGSHSAILPGSTSASHTFTTAYPKWGTRVAMPDVTANTPAALAAHQKFMVPITLRWVFEKGTDFPRLDTRLDLGEAVAGQLSFDMRGPYGVVEFADSDTQAPLSNVQWGDTRNHFTTQAPVAGSLTTQANWTWNEPIGATRKYHSLLARHSGTGVLYELGLVELKLGQDAGLVYGGYSTNNGSTKAATGRALLSGDFSAGEWPFQSAQYSGLNPNTGVTGKKFAWGSSPFYGSALASVYFNNDFSSPISAFPASKALLYRTCVVLGVSPFTDASRKSLTRTVAESASPSCATAEPL